ARRLKADHLVADVGTERADGITARRGWLRRELVERGDVLAQPLDEGGLAGLPRAEHDKRQAQHLDVNEVVNAVGAARERLRDFAIAHSAENGTEELVDHIGHGCPSSRILLRRLAFLPLYTCFAAKSRACAASVCKIGVE